MIYWTLNRHFDLQRISQYPLNKPVWQTSLLLQSLFSKAKDQQSRLSALQLINIEWKEAIDRYL